MKTPEIPIWVIEYNNANHQSSAGRAIKILMDVIKKKEDYETMLREETTDTIAQLYGTIKWLQDEVEYLKGVIKQTERDAAIEIDKYRDA